MMNDVTEIKRRTPPNWKIRENRLLPLNIIEESIIVYHFQYLFLIYK